MAKNRASKSSEKTNDEEKKKKKKMKTKKLISAQKTMAMKSKPPKENPFETIWSRRKFDVIGKKRKGEELRIGLARSRAIDKRKKTLLKEYEQSGKSSVFVDKRIGEQNDSLEEFDKAILRFQRERQVKLNKKSKYNLSDGEEDDFAIHGAGSLSKMDDFEDEMSPDDDEEATEKQKNSAFIKQINAQNNPLETGLLEGGENKHKTKKEVMEEIISKSKFYKAQKAKDKEEDDHLMEQLDKDFTSLAQSEVLLSLTQPGKIKALKALLNKGNTNEIAKEGLSGPLNKESSKQEQPDAYDRLVKEMVLDIRARPSDRTKTPEEIAQEEKERLEQLEEERRKRMLAVNDSSDEDGDDHEDFNNSSLKKLNPVSGDDLGDSFSVEDELPNKKGWVDEILERKNADDLENEKDTFSKDSESDEEDRCEDETDEYDGESGNTLSLKDWEQSDDDDLGTDLEEEEMEANMQIKEDSPKSLKPSISGKHRSIQQDALPFVIEAPNSLTELCSLLDNRSEAEVVEAINRIRACNAIRLAAENRKKMQIFYGVLLQYFAVLANRKPLNFKIMNLLVKPLIEMSVDTPYFAAICARQRLLKIRTQFCEDLKNPEKSSWPSLKTLSLLRLWSMVYPCSDFRHVVITPAVLLMCEYLMRCPIVSGRDVATGSLLCSMVFSVTKQSRKFCPEAILFLQTLLRSASEKESGLHQHSQCHYVMELETPKPWLHIRNQVSDVHSLDFLMVMDTPADSPFFSSDNFRASVLVSVIETLRGFVNIYEGFSAFPEIFLPISALLHEVAKQENLPDLLRGTITDVAQLIEKKADEHHILRQPVQMRKKKPVPIKLLNPKFEENFVKGRDYDPDRERSERKKLKKHIKQEAKGAARELRKDNYFLFDVKERERSLMEEERAEKYGKARAFLQEQEHAFKSGQLGKGRKRRR